jgi:SIR2-like domain
MSGIQFTPDLLDDFIHERVAIFLGAGVSAGVNTRTGNPIKTWANFLQSTADALPDKRVAEEVKLLIEQSDYLFACEILKDHLNDQWEPKLKDEFNQIGPISRLQEVLLGLKPRIIITTNFDLFIESHWEKLNPKATHHLQVKNGLSSECFSIFRDNNPYLIKLHGSINHTDSMIFSLSDYAAKAHANWQYSSFMETLLCTHTVIFIGFSMRDTAITNLLEIYAQRYPKSRPHYAFMPDYNSDRKIKIMKNYRKLFILPYQSKNNHKKLTSNLEALQKQIHERRRLTSTPTTA